jgi:serine/threonine protein kinase
MRLDPFDIIGTVVDGRYRVERVAGQGGFGVVYRAFHLGFEAPIALKMLKLPPHWSSAKREARVVAFQREGRMLFELSRLHPAIVRAFETGTLWTRGTPTPYLSLEWLDGVSLDHEIRHRRKNGLRAFTLDEILTLLADPAAGLARAHAQGIAHRDIKPGNLFVNCHGSDRSCKILDFGIAKMVSDDSEAESAGGSDGTGTASFTPKYAAPEQWSNRFGPTGPWTDVHALALLCSELLSGRPPFPNEDSAKLRAACLDANLRPTPASVGVSLPAPVAGVFLQALALDPRDRYHDVGAFWRALRDAAQWSPSAAGYAIFASTDEQEQERRIEDGMATGRSVSFVNSQGATSLTCSRETASSRKLVTRPRSLALFALLTGLALGGIGVSRRLKLVAHVTAAKPRPVPASASASAAHTTSGLVASLEVPRSAITASADGHVFPPKAALAPHGRPALKPGPNPRAPTTDSVAREVTSARPELPDVDLDDPGLVRRR